MPSVRKHYSILVVSDMDYCCEAFMAKRSVILVLKSMALKTLKVILQSISNQAFIIVFHFSFSGSDLNHYCK